MSIASQLNKQYSKPRPRNNPNTLSLLSTTPSVKSFSIRGSVPSGSDLAFKAPAERKLNDSRKESEDICTRDATEPQYEPTIEKSNTFESDKFLAAMWLKSRCVPSSSSTPETIEAKSAAKTSQTHSLIKKPAPIFAAKKNVIVRQCSKCQVLYTAAHACPLSITSGSPGCSDSK